MAHLVTMVQETAMPEISAEMQHDRRFANYPKSPSIARRPWSVTLYKM